MPADPMLQLETEVQVHEAAGGQLLVLVNGQAHRLGGIDRQLVQDLFSRIARGAGWSELMVDLGQRHGRIKVRQALLALKQTGAIRPTTPSLAAAMKSLIVLPKHLGTWEGDWFTTDSSGGLEERFRGVVSSQLVDDEWVGELRQYHEDGRVELQRFVSRITGPGRAEMVSLTPAMADYRFLMQEIDETRFMVELSEKESGLLRGVELVTLMSADERVRTMQGIRADGTFSGVLNVIEKRVE